MGTILVIAGLLPVISMAVGVWIGRRWGHRSLRGVVFGVLGANTVAIATLMVALLSAVSHTFAPAATAAASLPQQVEPATAQFAFLAAAISTGLATIGAGLAVGATGSAALGTIAERPELFGRSLVYVGLAEGIAIYGLIVSILILVRV